MGLDSGRDIIIVVLIVVMLTLGIWVVGELKCPTTPDIARLGLNCSSLRPTTPYNTLIII
jgi:hypothetical protein